MSTPEIKPATIYDVAREAGVSISTVSNVLNKPGRVGARTRERVLGAADRLGYVPKASAAQLARKRVGRIGVVAPFSAYPSYLRRLVGVMRAAAGEPIEISVIDHESAATASSPVLASMPLRGSVDGLLVMGSQIEQDIEDRWHQHGLPVVLVDAPSAVFSVVNIDDYSAGALAANHLLELGHRRIGYVLEQQESDYASQARRRFGGFRAAVEDRGGVDLVVTECEGTVQAAQAAGEALLASAERPTAVMAHFDDLALGVARAAGRAGLCVPDDLSVLGFDDGPVAEAAGLSTVRQPFEESGEVGLRLLLEAMGGHAQRRSTLLDCQVVTRGSTGAPR
ncbi:LacI family transcriptional regulator [Nocardioides salarius]|uniref:LacI family transcriptional regulator n=1 Tax=Nocardioides salarius TaxID=374513 RepID=A0ABS2M9V0_9ACTN|nr:LacI family DNA-binding transcriptional regulator [Nocardioides salarius]MBM7507971.1 LacI family transcriptional regulator [Nocardioides salarius]